MHVHKGSCENLFIFCLFRQFMSDARDCESYLRQLQETIKRQYTCDKNSRLSKLEDLLQDSMVSTAQLSFYLQFWPQENFMNDSLQKKKSPKYSYTAFYNSIIPQLFLPAINEGTKYLDQLDR